jgi:hypothetical protein
MGAYPTVDQAIGKFWLSSPTPSLPNGWEGLGFLRNFLLPSPHTHRLQPAGINLQVLGIFIVLG